MKAVFGILVGAVIAGGAFYMGLNYDLEAEEGPVEQIGERIDETIKDAQRAANGAAD